MVKRIASMNLFLTERCNLKCKHCGAHKEREVQLSELTINEYNKIFREAAEMGCSEVVFTGGEPFLREDIYDILSIANRYNIQCTILSNGTLIDDDVINKLKSYPNIKFIRFSLEFIENSDMEKFRGIKNIPETIWRTAKKLKNIGIKTGINMTIMPENFSEVETIVQRAKEEGVDYFRAIPLMPIGKATNTEMNEKMFSDLITKVININTKLHDYKTAIYNPIKDLNKFSNDMTYPCAGGKDSISISPYGEVTLCAFSRIKANSMAGNKKPLEDIIDELLEEKGKVTQIILKTENKCSSCSLKNKCLGGCYAEMQCRYDNYSSGQPICLNTIWKNVIKNIEEDAVANKVLEEFKLKSSMMDINKMSICLRTLPIWNIRLN